MKERLRGVAVSLDPLRLLDEIRSMQHYLAALAAGSPARIPPGRNPDLEKFLSGLATAWREGEVRPTHRTKPRARRYWRTRVDPFEAVWPRIRSWLDVEPDRNAKQLLLRLEAEYPGEFSGANLRTLQRRVRAWRAETAKRLVFGVHDRSVGGADSTGTIPS